MTSRLRVLVVEDTEDDALLVTLELRSTFGELDFHRVDSRQGLEQALRSPWDVVISDYNLPGFSAMEALEVVRAKAPDLPFILVTGTIGEEAAVAALKAGVDDYVLKGNLVRLGPAVQRHLREVKERLSRRRSEQALADSEERFRQLAQNIDSVFYLANPDNTQLHYLSPAYRNLYGRSVEEVLANPRLWQESIHPEDREAVISSWRDTLSGPVTRRYRIVRPDRAVRWVRARAFPVLDESGQPYRIAGIIDDETERKAAEDRIARLNRVYAVLSGINSVMAHLPSRSQLVEQACRIAVEAGGIRMAWLGLYDRVGMAVRPIATYGHEEGFVALMPLSLDDPSPESRGPVVPVLRRRRAVIMSDIERENQFELRSEALARGYRSAAVLPLLVGGELIGVLGLFAGEPEFFDAEEMRLLSKLAGDISFALDHIAKTEQLEYLACYDALTGLANRTLFLETLDQALAAAMKDGRQLALIVSDVERFKAVNDSFGRASGDLLLTRVVQRLKDCVLDDRQLSRIGPDQFAIAIPDISSELEVGGALSRLAKACFGEPFPMGHTELRVSAKAGIALFPGDGTDAETLLTNAETALKRSKRRGDRFVFFTEEISRRVAANLSMENDLRRAIEREEFVLHYQPRVDLSNGRICGLEALIRWQKGGALVAPSEFIPLLEETGLILEVGAWALRQAVRDHGKWVSEGIAAPRVAVNVSTIQLRQRDFVAQIRRVVEEGARPVAIDLEVTESRLMDDVEGNIAKLRCARDLGLRIAIDDFGTGYSSLYYLSKLPVDSLKIDRSFIVTMLSDPSVMTLVRTIISLAKELKLRVTAEGVDAEEQLAVLQSLGCDEVQGFLVSRALPADEMLAALRS